MRLYYTINNAIDPRACAGMGQSSFCGVSSQANGPVVMTVTPIPEPSTYALMLAGLGAVGFMARRRRVS